jgi:hypothetical protein
MRRGNFFLVGTTDELIDSIIEFNSKPEYIRQILGNNPKYFVFTKFEDQIMFGLSKFCAFQNITPEVYIKEARRATSGGNTQEHIAKTTNQNWQEKSRFSKQIIAQFDNWISNIFPSHSNHAFWLLELANTKGKKTKVETGMSLKTFLDRLEKQRKIGEIGELIAFEFEAKRIGNLGCKRVDEHLFHVSLKHTSAGFDIYSSYKGERYIEVKSTTKEVGEFYITANEMQILEHFDEKAYLYIVKIEDLMGKIGTVTEIQCPIKHLREHGTFEPLLYRVGIQDL